MYFSFVKKKTSNHPFIWYFGLAFLLFGASTTLLFAQKPDSTRLPANSNLLLLSKDTTNFEDKYIVSELEKVQYANYSENLKKIALEKLLENQKLQNASLQQKLQNEQLKVETERKQAQAKRQQEIQKQKIKQLEINELNQRLTLQNRTRNFLLGGLGLLTLLGLSLFWSNQQLKKRNRAIQKLSAENLEKEQEKQQILATQNETLERQVTERTAELKASQNQLIQKEKLASLGELTAGIAHEIQNPLNFVNNFSELSVELISELLEERNKKNEERDEELEKELLNDLAQNQEKINLHGKRAASIVKGMLEHSRTNTGERIATDLNKLADEYLRLSYHGMRAKDKSFNASFQLEEDEQLPIVQIVPQEIGRVLLNLINNAFYAVNERAKQAESNYHPQVTVSTKYSHRGRGAVVTVQDNGFGIPTTIIPKIFQPFFTTKPTGEGTGLGLSLAYDIITKGHGGALEVESVEGEGTTFIVKLPIPTV